ncbi:MAG: hypothetical protein FD177_2514, partial [Desulfovibrionaceae bacterium]
IDWSHPLAQGLALAAPINEGVSGRIRNVVDGTVAAAIGTAGTATSEYINTSAYYEFSITVPADEFTVLVDTYSASYVASKDVLSLGIGGTYKTTMTTVTGPYLVQYQNSLTGASALTTSTEGIAGARCKFAHVASKTRNSNLLMRDGRTLVSGAWSVSSSLVFDQLRVANRVGDTSRGQTYRLYGLYVWKRALSTGEIAALSENPWQIFQTVRRVVYVDMAAGSTQDASHIASGGATSGGSAESSREAAAVASGGATSGASGGATAGGAAEASNSEATQDASHTGSGGTTSGGSASSSRESIAAGQGGATSGGQATQIRETTATGSGGAVSGGAAVASASTAGEQAVRPSVVRLQGVAVRTVRIQGIAIRSVRLSPAIFRRVQ